MITDAAVAEMNTNDVMMLDLTDVFINCHVVL